MRLRPRLMLLTGMAAVFVTVLGIWLVSRYFDAALMETTEQASILDGDEIRGVLEAQMMSEDRSALVRLVNDIGRAPGVAWVGLLDTHGTVKLSSDPGSVLKRFAEDSLEYQKLQAWEETGRTQTHAVLRPGCSVLRTLSPLPNAQACHKCHDAAWKLNGVLIIDRSLKPMRQTMAVAKVRLGLGGLAGLVVLLGALGLTIERTVLRRLETMREATRSLGSGNLAARVEESGADEIADLAHDFDHAAERLESAMVALAAQRRQLEEIVNGIADGIVLVDVQGRVLAINRACASLINGERPPTGAAYRELLRAAGIEVPDGLQLPAERALSSGSLEKEVVRAGGGHRVEELYAQPLRGPGGRIVGAIEVWRDITERKEFEAVLEQSERLASLGVLASSIAHEVGNPLASIVTAVDGLLARLPDDSSGSPQEIRDYLEIVRKQVFRCRGVTERLLGFARVPSTQDVEIDVGAAAREILVLVAHQARAQRVECEVLAPDRTLAAAPDMLVEQVFLNLVLNSLKAMPSGGKLLVRVSAQEDGVAVAFSDTGHGIPENVRKHLFQPFRRAKQDGSGTGLGLFISQVLIARAGGSIDVESKPGRGSTFTVRLRRAIDPPAPRFMNSEADLPT